MSNLLAFEYSLTRRGKSIYFRVREQGQLLYNDRVLSQINSIFRERNIPLSVYSCDCPELTLNYIYLRGEATENDYELDVSCWFSATEASIAFVMYSQALKTIKEFLSTYTDDGVLRKIRELRQRYKNKQFHSVSSSLPFPKDI